MAFSLGEYQDIFLEEADEQIQELNQNLLELEKNPEDFDIINNIFRAAHSFRALAGDDDGAARFENVHRHDHALDRLVVGPVQRIASGRGDDGGKFPGDVDLGVASHEAYRSQVALLDLPEGHRAQPPLRHRHPRRPH